MNRIAEPDCQQALQRFGLSNFRAGQGEVISAVLEGRNCLCIMPTGGGKSLCYQLPSVVRDGMTLVISPLIALMKDQVDALTERNISATYINSTLDSGEQRIRLNKMMAGEYDLVYVAPERLRSNAFVEALKSSNMQLLAIDEAHCISEWGHDFRPDYARIGRFRERLRNPQTIALTATATVHVREDIRAQLELDTPSTFITGFARENLSFEVWQTKSFRDKQEALLRFLEANEGAGIIYAATRKRCEELVELLRETPGRRVGFYHAGLMPDERRLIQEQFMSGEVPLIVATNAFGMGIDKSDLRFVVHYNLPGTIEAYYQEAGRAGRDGKPSKCLLLFSYADRAIQEFFIENAYPPKEIVKQVYDFLRGRNEDPIELTLQETKEMMGLSVSPEAIGVSEQTLHKCGGIERLDSQQNMGSVRISSDLPTLVDLLPREAKTRRRVLREVEKEVGEMRGERVYFHPRHLADRLDMKPEALARAFRELNRLDAFDYVSPFRGKAVHVVDRRKTFEDLNVDFEELNRRRKSEYDKLDAVVQYAYTNRCRQLTILEYFGDSNQFRCGKCDCCGFDGKAASVVGTEIGSTSQVQVIESEPVHPAVVHVMRICLSGVARTHGRFGKTLIGQMLWGSKDKKVKKLGLTRLSTFGMLKRLTQTEVQLLLESLSLSRLIQQTETTKFRPLTSITEKGQQVMKGKAGFGGSFVIDKKLEKKIIRLFAKEAAVTTTKPDKEDETPPVAVEPVENKQVERKPVEHKPVVSEPKGSSVVDGSGNHWVDASEFVEDRSRRRLDAAQETLSPTTPMLDEGFASDRSDEANEFQKDYPEADDQFKVDKLKSDDEPPVPSTVHSEAYWTWRLFVDGYQLDDVLALRRIDRGLAVSQLIDAVNQGLAVNPEWVIQPVNFATMEKYRDESDRAADLGENQPAPPLSVPRDEFALFFAIRSQSVKR